MIAKPLIIFINKDQPWTWRHEQQDAFDMLKQKLDSISILQYPDAIRPSQLYKDLSAIRLEVVLIQNDDIKYKYVFIFVFISNNNVETNYLSYKEEALAIVWTILHF